MVAHHPFAGRHRDRVAGLDGEVGVHVEVGVHHDHVAHLARRTACTPITPGVPASVASMAATSPRSAALSIRSLQGRPRERGAHAPHEEADDGRRDGVEQRVSSRLPMMPRLTTSDDAASERACHALAISMLDRTRLPTASM